MDQELNDEELFENRYQANNSLLKEMEKEKRKKLALPIKDESGLLVDNFTEIADNEKEAESKAVKKQKNVVESLPIEEYKPKTAFELIRLKTEIIEQCKEKIAYLSRMVISNPQEEVSLY
jgi:hypothetical protein